jgi:hypothetical protein
MCSTSPKLSDRAAQVQEYFCYSRGLGQKSLADKDLRQKDFSRFLAIFAHRKRGFLSFLLFEGRFLGPRNVV